MDVILYVILGVAVLWSIWGALSSRVEQAQYEVLKKNRGYEIRRYPAHIVAQTTVIGDYDKALREGFRIIAAYIFGYNSSRESVAMTAPVLEQRSQKIAMTAPVKAEDVKSARKISFVMPRSFTTDTLPTPKDPRVKIVEVPEQIMAVVRFSWYRSARRIENKKMMLLSLLKRDGIKTKGMPLYAGYNAPGTAPWMMRNEVMVEIEKE